MSAQNAFEELAASIVGLPLSHMWRGYGSAVFLEFGQLHPQFYRDGSAANSVGNVSLSVEWSWRIESDQSVLCGSWSDDDEWYAKFSKLVGSRLKHCSLFGRPPEISIVFENDLRFLSFTTTEGQPRWNLIDRRSELHRWYFVKSGAIQLGDGSEPA